MYPVIIITDSDKKKSAVKHFLEGSGYYSVTGCGTIEQVLDLLNDSRYEIVLSAPPKNIDEKKEIIQKIATCKYTPICVFLHEDSEKEKAEFVSHLWVDLFLSTGSQEDENLKKLSYWLFYIIQRSISDRFLIASNRFMNQMNQKIRHDIMNQLTSLLGYMELSSEYIEDPMAKEFFRRQSDAAKTILKLAEFTRKYQDIGIKDPYWQNINSIFRTSLSGASLPIKSECKCEELEILADKKIFEIFHALVENSVVHNKDKTELAIKMFYKHSEKQINGIILTFEDNGEGIPDQNKEKIFHHCFGEDTGLGLYFVREMLSTYGITIHECGVPGEGTRFEMKIPEGMFRFSGISK